MDPKRLRRRNTLVAAGIAVALASTSVVYISVSILGSGESLEYFKEVDEALAQLDQVRDRRLRLHGNVVAGTIQKRPGSLDYRFAVFHRKRWVEVTYRGLVPDTFKDCAEVVLKGRFASVGGRLETGVEFKADNVTAKCPSKYDEKQRLTGCGEQLKPLVLAARGGQTQ